MEKTEEVYISRQAPPTIGLTLLLIRLKMADMGDYNSRARRVAGNYEDMAREREESKVLTLQRRESLCHRKT